MSELRKEIFDKVLELSPIDRAELMECLMSSFDFPSKKAIDKLWAEEAENRIDAFERGEIASKSAKKIFGRIGKK